MIVSSWILLVLGCLGGLDILLFHSIGHGLRTHAPSRAELVSHAARGPVYGFLFVAVPCFAFTGAWWWLVVGVLAADLLVSLWDFALERASRAALGGLATGEYVLHVLIGIAYGALFASVLFESAPLRTQPSGVAWIAAGPPLALRLALAGMAVGTLTSALLDLRAVARLRRASTSRPA